MPPEIKGKTISKGKGVLTRLLYARDDALRTDYKTNKIKGKHCNYLSPAVKRSCHWTEGTTLEILSLWFFVLLGSNLWSRVYKWWPQQSSAGSPTMWVEQALLQKSRESGTCRVPWYWEFRYWLLLKRQEDMDYRKGGQERKCPRII